MQSPTTIEIPDNQYFSSVTELKGHDESHGAIFDLNFAACKYSGDSFMLASASGDHSVRLFSLPSGKHLRTLFKDGGHMEWVTFVACLDGGDVLSAALDGQILWWRKGTVKGVNIAQMGSIASGFFNRKTQEAVFAGSHATVGFTRGGSCTWQTSVMPNVKAAPNLTTCSIVCDKYVTVGSRDGWVFVLDKTQGVTLFKKQMFSQSVICAGAFNDLCIFGGADGRIAFIPTGANGATRSFEDYTLTGKGVKGRVTTFCVDDDYLFAAKSDGTISMYEYYEGSADFLGDFDILPGIPILTLIVRYVDRDYLVYCGHSDGTFTIWSYIQKALVFKMPVCRGGLGVMRYIPELQQFVIAGDDAVVRVLHMK